MKTNENGQENHFTISVSVFYYWKRVQEHNRHKHDIWIMEMGGNQTIYRNTLLFNHCSPRMNTTLHSFTQIIFLRI